jgi:adenylate cyclase
MTTTPGWRCCIPSVAANASGGRSRRLSRWRLKLGGELREVTILVSDLRGFTSLTAQLSPHQVIAMLNRYLERMVDMITTYRGMVDELQGDGILAVFGAQLAAADDRQRAIACAVAMQTAMVEINAA